MERKYSEEQEIFSDFYKARGRKYYFDVKKKENGSHYITISELQPNNPKFKRMRIMVFEEYLSGFVNKLQNVLSKLNELSLNVGNKNENSNGKNNQQPEVNQQSEVKEKTEKDENNLDNQEGI